MSNPEASDSEALALRGDAVGQTVYSERWILRLLMRLNKLITREDLFDESLETDLCLLWDMAAEEDVALFLCKHDVVTIVTMAVKSVWKSQEFRFCEILVGIVGNLSAVKEVRENIMQSTDFKIMIGCMLSYPNASTLIQVMRVLQIFAHDVRNNVVECMQERHYTEHAYSAIQERKLDEIVSYTCRENYESKEIDKNAYAEGMSQDSGNYPGTSGITLSDSSDVEILSLQENDCDDIEIIEVLEVDKLNKKSDRTTVYESVAVDDDEIQILEYVDEGINKPNNPKQHKNESNTKTTHNDELETKLTAGSYNDDRICVTPHLFNDGRTVQDSGIIDDNNLKPDYYGLQIVNGNFIITDGGTIDSENEDSEPAYSGSQIVTTDNETVQDGGVISSDDDDYPEIIAIVRGKSVIKNSSCLWYDEFVKVAEWIPQITSILNDTKNINLIKGIWSLLSTLCFIRDGISYLGCRMASPELLKSLFASFDENFEQYFGFEISDDVEVPDMRQCRSSFIDWTTVLYSFTFSEDSLRFCNSWESQIVFLILKMFRRLKHFLPVDEKLCDWISQCFAILETFVNFELVENRIIEFSREDVQSILAVLAAVKENQDHGDETVEAAEKFLTKLLQRLNTLNANRQIGELKLAFQELHDKFHPGNDT